MDLIYANEAREDLGVVRDYTLDLAYGGGENDFELTVSTGENPCAPGYVIYVEGTDYGGVIDRVDVKTEGGTLTYAGRTWHGVLEHKILAPDAGEDYLTLTGDANRVLEQLIARCGLENLFRVVEDNSGIEIHNYRMDRYITAYTGISKMLSRSNAKLAMHYTGGSVAVSAVARTLYDEDSQAGLPVEFDISRTAHKVNHLVCLGAGELADRTVIDLYADADGVISQTPTYTGAHEVAEIYENTNAETETDLISDGTARFKELRDVDRIDLTLAADDAIYDVGDQVCATERTTGLTVTQIVQKKIVTIQGGEASVAYEIGGRIN